MTPLECALWGVRMNSYQFVKRTIHLIFWERYQLADQGFNSPLNWVWSSFIGNAVGSVELKERNFSLLWLFPIYTAILRSCPLLYLILLFSQPVGRQQRLFVVFKVKKKCTRESLSTCSTVRSHGCVWDPKVFLMSRPVLCMAAWVKERLCKELCPTQVEIRIRYKVLCGPFFHFSVGRPLDFFLFLKHMYTKTLQTIKKGWYFRLTFAWTASTVQWRRCFIHVMTLILRDRLSVFRGMARDVFPSNL